mgnify:CR=1 FL=1
MGDVSGKAMKAAMIAVMSSGMIYSKVKGASSPAAIMNELNPPVFSKTDANMFTTLLLVELDTTEKRMTFVNAGFSDPILRSGGKVTLVGNEGSRLPLGLLEGSTYEERTIALQSGDVLVLYSDGIPDAINRHQEYYEIESLELLVGSPAAGKLSAAGIKEMILDDVRSFAGKTKQNDDMTVVVIRVL